MGPVNWLAVMIAALVAAGVWIASHGTVRAALPVRRYGAVAVVMLIGAAMLGHNYARIGAQTLHAKPWLYPMQSGGIALFFIIPAVWLASAGKERGFLARLVDPVCWLLAYLAMGAVFWGLG